MQFVKLDENFVFEADVVLDEHPVTDAGEPDPHYVEGPAPAGYILPAVHPETGEWYECGQPPVPQPPVPSIEERVALMEEAVSLIAEVVL